MEVTQDRSKLSGSIKVFSTAVTVLGLLSIALPAPGLNIAVVMGTVVLLVGVAYGYLATGVKATRPLVLCLLVATSFVVGGLILLLNPAMDRLSLTKIVAIVFVVEAAAIIAAYVSLRDVGGSGLLLVSATITLIVACIIWFRWPSSSTWALGAPVGINLISSGLTPLVFVNSIKASKKAVVTP